MEYNVLIHFVETDPTNTDINAVYNSHILETLVTIRYNNLFYRIRLEEQRLRDSRGLSSSNDLTLDYQNNIHNTFPINNSLSGGVRNSNMVCVWWASQLGWHFNFWQLATIYLNINIFLFSLKASPIQCITRTTLREILHCGYMEALSLVAQ